MAIPVIVVDPLQDELEQLELWSDGRHLQRELSNIQLPGKKVSISHNLIFNLEKVRNLSYLLVIGDCLETS